MAGNSIKRDRSLLKTIRGRGGRPFVNYVLCMTVWRIKIRVFFVVGKDWLRDLF